MKVQLIFKSPFITGGKKLSTNYIESIDYIPGNIVRAAFARYILNNCIEYKFGETVVVDGVKRRNWVYYRNGRGCINCRIKNICMNFSNIRFSYFYPEGTKVIPLTAMKCKNNEEHGFIDCLIDQKVCKKCSKDDGRVEFVSGFIKDGRSYKPKKKIITRTATDTYTKTSYEGKLYSLVVVDETSRISKDGDYVSRNIFEGIIENAIERDFDAINELRIGSYTSVGFGRCSVEALKNENFQAGSTPAKMKTFSDKYKSINKVDSNRSYFAIKFVSDAKLNFNIDQGLYISTDTYKRIWEKAIGFEDEFKIHKVYAETFNYRGYDTSKIEDDKREDVVTMVQKGSVIVFESGRDFEYIHKYLCQKSGVGSEQENGFGWFEIYCGGVHDGR